MSMSRNMASPCDRCQRINYLDFNSFPGLASCILNTAARFSSLYHLWFVFAGLRYLRHSLSIRKHTKGTSKEQRWNKLTQGRSVSECCGSLGRRSVLGKADKLPEMRKHRHHQESLGTGAHRSSTLLSNYQSHQRHNTMLRPLL